MESIKVLIADDHELIRQGLEKILNLETHIKVVGQAADGQEVLDLVEQLEPDVVLMDINMPVLNGLEATERLRESFPHVQIIVLTIHDDEDYLHSLIKAGARGYLLKDAPTEKIVEAIEQVAQGEAFLPSTLMTKLFDRVQRPQGGRQDQEMAHELTPREQEVLACVAQGMKNGEIAAHLFISEKTVKNHISNILHKLQVADRTQAALYALRVGLVKMNNRT
ncbi:MAG: response regulator [Limnochordia bacterium]|jgi:two-component system response regulator DegU